MSKKIYIGVGANINPGKNIKKAFTLLAEKVKITGVSTFYITPALEAKGPDFLNGVWEIETDLPPGTLKTKVLRPIEAVLGRVRGKDKYAPRPLDLDLLLYGSLVEEKIPDPDIYTRPFIGIPLRELNPELMLPDKKIVLSSLTYSEKDMTPEEELTRSLRNALETLKNEER